MRHGDKVNNLGRTRAHREALLANLSIALITHKRIVTTLAKAKALRRYIEPLMTKTKLTANKEQISHNHRLVFAKLNDKAAIMELFTVIAPKIASRPGGYTRIIKLSARMSDNADRAMIELVDFNEIYGKHIAPAAGEPAKRTRRAGGSKKAATTEVEEAPVVSETPVTEAPIEPTAE